MIRTLWKTVCISLALSLILQGSAQACGGPQFEYTVFFSSMPASVEGIDSQTEFIGSITLKEKKKWFFFAADDSEKLRGLVHESITHPELVGTYIDVFPIFGTSCGPWAAAGDSGIVSGAIVASDDTRLLIRVNSHPSVQYFNEAR